MAMATDTNDTRIGWGRAETRDKWLDIFRAMGINTTVSEPTDALSDEELETHMEHRDFGLWLPARVAELWREAQALIKADRVKGDTTEFRRGHIRRGLGL